jgi:hypothetical protein
VTVVSSDPVWPKAGFVWSTNDSTLYWVVRVTVASLLHAMPSLAV